MPTIYNRLLEDGKCCICGVEFLRRKGSLYCGGTCRAKAHRNRTLLPNLWKLNHNGLGDISELIVAVDLIKKGFQVFRSLTSHGPCDLIAVKNKNIFRIEVKTVSETRCGRICRIVRSTKEHYDVLAAVTHGGKIAYEGEIL